MEESSGHFDNPNEVPPEVLVSEIQRGNSQAETIFYNRFQKGLVLMLERRTGDRARAEDIAQDVLLTVLTRLRTTGIDHPERLSSFVHQTAKYQFIGWLRKAANRTELDPDVGDSPANEDSVEETIDRERTRSEVRALILEMNVARDREILFRFYVRDQPKPVICEALDLSNAHFDRVINRARNRFRELLIRKQTANG